MAVVELEEIVTTATAPDISPEIAQKVTVEEVVVEVETTEEAEDMVEIGTMDTEEEVVLPAEEIVVLIEAAVTPAEGVTIEKKDEVVMHLRLWHASGVRVAGVIEIGQDQEKENTTKDNSDVLDRNAKKIKNTCSKLYYFHI